MADAADTAASSPGDTCRAHTRCRCCGAVVGISGREPDEVLAALVAALREEGWSLTSSGLRLCAVCTAREPTR